MLSSALYKFRLTIKADNDQYNTAKVDLFRIEIELLFAYLSKE